MFKVTGKILLLGVKKSGVGKSGNAWNSQELVIEYEDESTYPKKMSLTMFNKEFNLAIGQNVTVEFHIDAKEYNGKYYNNLMVSNINIDHYLQSKPKKETKTHEQENDIDDNLVF